MEKEKFPHTLPIPWKEFSLPLPEAIFIVPIPNGQNFVPWAAFWSVPTYG